MTIVHLHFVVIFYMISKICNVCNQTNCGVKYPSWIMDFDHLHDKLFGLGSRRAATSNSVSKIISEINKCEVVCSNCHRHRTYCRMMGIQIYDLKIKS